jgi:D-cysteine desulfhydrase family pyridoxal phosphate-dependent enzyme
VNIPRICFAHLPTPIDVLPRLGAALGGVRVLVKRDDQTGLAFGGNKTRKLEYVLAEALANGAKTLVTVGAAQSNHCRQTSALAARYDLGCVLVLSGSPPEFPGGNLLLDELFGAEIVWCSAVERNEVLKATFNRVWEEGRRPYLIPLGASNATGAVAYAAAFDEMIEQLGSGLPDWIVVASSSGGTQAGLALGAHHREFHGRVLGISVDHPAQELRETVAFLAREAADRIGWQEMLRPDEVMVNDDYLGEGYGSFGVAEREAVRVFGRTEGLLLDPVYTGRAPAGLIDLTRKGFFHPGETILFWHTGGTPALFADGYSERLIQG